MKLAIKALIYVVAILLGVIVTLVALAALVNWVYFPIIGTTLVFLTIFCYFWSWMYNALKAKEKKKQAEVQKLWKETEDKMNQIFQSKDT